MINKAKWVLKKLEFGLLEFFVAILMAIGLFGYFSSVPADLDWIDHTISFVLFTYLFYKLDITSILLGKSSKFANLAIIISYFSLFFKDIAAYTRLSAFHFKVLTFVDYFYLFISNNLLAINLATFYIGIAGILLISFYLAKKIEASHPSLLYAIFPKKFKNKAVKFFLIFLLLLGFYYFVYNTIIEWLEFVIDDPVIATGIAFYVYKIAKHHNKFDKSNFVFRIGDFSAKWYTKCISLLHYKKTLPLAISGLIILHALSDLGVFAYSLALSKENFYFGILNEEHVPFLRLFMDDAKYLPSNALAPLLIGYLLNALSLIIFLLIPVAVWARMFSRKELYISRIFLFFIYSSAVAYMLLPGYIIGPLKESSIRGADISTISLLETSSILNAFFQNKLAIVFAVPIISILFGLAIYLLSSNSRIEKELYAISIIGGLTFYAVYLYYFSSSLLAYFYSNILLTISTPHFLIGMIFLVLLLLSALFYIGGYAVFLYEIVMEYHKRKWSDAIDEELVSIIKKTRNFERAAIKPKKAQIAGDVVKYSLIALFSLVVLVFGYKMVSLIKERACSTEISKFEIDLRNIDKSLRFGARELQSHDAPCGIDKIYFFDLSKKINPEDFKDIPLIKDSLQSGASNNVFLIKENDVKRSFYAGSLGMIYPYHICFVPQFGRISFFAEGAGNSINVVSACGQPECTFIPVNISDEDALEVIQEALDFGCINCPTDLNQDFEKMKLTRKNVEILRKFTSCDGIAQVEILIKPKEGKNLRDFVLYEYVPKSCIDDLSEYLAEEVEGNVEIKSDPLIMWYFQGLDKETKVSYKLNTEFNEECMQLIKGMAISQRIVVIEKGSQPEIADSAPVIAGLPDTILTGEGFKQNVISSLWKYTKDRETKSVNLVYRIIKQTNPSLVECSISKEKHVDCEVMENKNGSSTVTVEVYDNELADTDSFDVEISQFCKRHSKKACDRDTVYWFDSCGNKQELIQECKDDKVCFDGNCVERKKLEEDDD